MAHVQDLEGDDVDDQQDWGGTHTKSADCAAFNIRSEM